MNEKTGWQPEPDETAAQHAADLHESGQHHPHDDAEDFAPNDDDVSTFAVLGMLFSQGKAYASNELERQKLRASILGKAARDALILVVIALFLLMGTLIAGMIGLILALAPLVGGALAATGIVIAASLILIVILLLIAKSRVSSAKGQAFPRQPEDIL